VAGELVAATQVAVPFPVPGTLFTGMSEESELVHVALVMIAVGILQADCADGPYMAVNCTWFPGGLAL
jgi:hypothetical protein